MKNSIILILILFASLFVCCKRPLIPNKNLLIGNWISVKDRFDNIFYLTIEDDLMLENIYEGIDPVVPYKLSYDTLIIFPKDYKEYPVIITKILKFKITNLDSSNFAIIPIAPNFRDTIVFKRTIFSKKNDLRTEKIEFSSSPCFGTCPCQDILIGQDSILYHYGYGSFSKHKGYSSHKLNPNEYSRIMTRLNSIYNKDIKLCSPAPDAQHFHLFIKSANDSIEIDGMICENLSQELVDFVTYLNTLERFISLDSIEGIGPRIKYKYNRDNFLK